MQIAKLRALGCFCHTSAGTVPVLAAVCYHEYAVCHRAPNEGKGKACDFPAALHVSHQHRVDQLLVSVLQVVLHTTFGPLDIELWPKEAPMVQPTSECMMHDLADVACLGAAGRSTLQLQHLGQGLSAHTAAIPLRLQQPSPSQQPASVCLQATRNFVQLCMEGFYNGTPFFRMVKGAYVQGGDPTGTGNSGESIYGHPFKDEFHSRLRFTHR